MFLTFENECKILFVQDKNTTSYLQQLSKHLENGRGKIVDSLDQAINLTETEGQKI
jgi:hypothetical protein